MTGIVRARYSLEFKQEAVRLVRGGQSLTSVSRGLGVSAQSIDNWVKADAVGGLKEAKGKPVNADQMEIARLKAELARMRMKHDILKKRRWVQPATPYLAFRYALRLDPPAAQSLEQGPRHTYQSKASIMRRYVQEGVGNEVKAVTKVYYSPLS